MAEVFDSLRHTASQIGFPLCAPFACRLVHHRFRLLPSGSERLDRLGSHHGSLTLDQPRNTTTVKPKPYPLLQLDETTDRFEETRWVQAGIIFSFVVTAIREAPIYKVNAHLAMVRKARGDQNISIRNDFIHIKIARGLCRLHMVEFHCIFVETLLSGSRSGKGRCRA